MGKITITEWHRRYIQRLTEHYKFDESFASDMLIAGMGNYDYDDSPEDSADEEMNYWHD